MSESRAKSETFISRFKVCLLIWGILSSQIEICLAKSGKTSEPKKNSIRQIDELRREIGELRRITVKKINDDANIIAEGFTNSEAIMRRLRLAYTFKTALDSVANGFGLVATVADVKNVKDAFGKAKNPLEWASLGLIVDSVREDGKNLAFAFNGTSFVAGVDEMIETAKSSQPVIGFDEPRYRSSIEQSLFGFNGHNIVIASHKKPLDPCQIIKPRGEKFERIASFKNLDEIRRYLNNEIRQLETEIAGRKFTAQQIIELIALIKQAKTALLESNLHTTLINLTLPWSLTTPKCKPNNTKISLGRIASQQTILSTAYQAFEQNLAVEQSLTFKTALDGVTSATQVYLAGKGGKAKQKVLEQVSKLSLGADIGIWTAQKVFQSEPEKLISKSSG